MDPNATVKMIQEYLDAENLAYAMEAAEDLFEWLAKGGFVPTERLETRLYYGESATGYVEMLNLLLDVATSGSPDPKGMQAWMLRAWIKRLKKEKEVDPSAYCSLKEKRNPVKKGPKAGETRQVFVYEREAGVRSTPDLYEGANRLGLAVNSLLKQVLQQADPTIESKVPKSELESIKHFCKWLKVQEMPMKNYVVKVEGVLPIVADFYLSAPSMELAIDFINSEQDYLPWVTVWGDNELSEDDVGAISFEVDDISIFVDDIQEEALPHLKARYESKIELRADGVTIITPEKKAD